MIYIQFNKPYFVLSQFKEEENKLTLKNFIHHPSKPTAAGRLDYDSEGLLLLTDDKNFLRYVTDPGQKLEKEYHVQIEGTPKKSDLIPIFEGLNTQNISYQPAIAEMIPEPVYLWERNPPIRFRKNKPTSWLRIVIREGKNRQVRKMTAAIGFPTLRLIRYRIGRLVLQNLSPGEWREFGRSEL